MTTYHLGSITGLFSLTDKVIGLTHETSEACHQLEVVEDIPNEILMTLFGGCPARAGSSWVRANGN